MASALAGKSTTRGTMKFFSKPFGINLKVVHDRLFVKSSLWRDIRPGAKFDKLVEADGKTSINLGELPASQVEEVLRNAALPVTLEFLNDYDIEKLNKEPWETDADAVRHGMGVFDISEDQRKEWEPNPEEDVDEMDFWPKDDDWWRSEKAKKAKFPPTSDEDKRAVEEFLKTIKLEEYADLFPSMSQLARMKREDLKKFELPPRHRQTILHELEHWRQIQNIIKFGAKPYEWPDGLSQHPASGQSYGEFRYKRVKANDTDQLLNRIPKDQFQHFNGVYGLSPHNVPTKETMLLEKWSKVWNKLGKKDPEKFTARLDEIRKEGPQEVVALVEHSRQEGFEGKQINHHDFNDYDRHISGKFIFQRKRRFPVWW